MLFVAVLFVVATTSQAASGLDLLYMTGSTVNFLEDDDWEIVIKGTGNTNTGILEVGDLLVGMFRIGASKDASPGVDADKSAAVIGATLAGVFVTEYAGDETVTIYEGTAIEQDRTFQRFIPYDGSWSTLFGSKFPLVGLAALGLPEPTADGTIGIIYSDTDVPAFGTGTQAFIDQGAAGADPTLDTLAEAFGTATDGTALWEIGFAGWDTTTDTTSNSNEWWRSASGILVPPSTLAFWASMNVTANFGAPDLLPHGWLFNGVDTTSAGFSATSSIQAGGGNGSAGTGLFLLSTDTDFYIVPTPEPGSLILLGLGLAACGGVVYRRRRNS
jgi:hypothetical protein